MKKYIYIGAVLVIILVGYYGVNAIFTTSYDIPTTLVDRGEFIVSVKASGRIDAKRNYTVSAPRIRGLQITWLAPEGSMANKGDPIIKFDATQQLNDLTDHQSTLKINQKTLDSRPSCLRGQRGTVMRHRPTSTLSYSDQTATSQASRMIRSQCSVAPMARQVISGDPMPSESPAAVKAPL